MQRERTALPIMLFADPEAWTSWLETNHAAERGVWLQLAKKASGIASVTYHEALDVALCYGWIDGQKKPYDEKTWLQKFTPRGAKSVWSQINREKVQRLIEQGAMRPAGQATVDLAKQDGRWEAAYASQRTMTVPPDFQAALDGNLAARDFFDTLNRANRYAFLFRIETAKKAETRARRIQEFIAMLERHEQLH